MRKKLLSFIITALIVLFNILVIFYPTEAISAAREATALWANNVLPSLLPFFIGTNILTGLGFINFAGVMLEPVMKPLFNVPGCGGFALAVGMTSGYPLGAKVCADLRESKQLTKTEAHRLISFVNNSGPLFMIGSVGTGMFASASAGYLILISNFLAALITGCLLKYYKHERPATYLPRKGIIKHAIRAMETAREADGRPFGKILADSVAKSLESVIHIAGFIILFCVVIKVSEAMGILKHISYFFESSFNLQPHMADGIAYGILEVTNGANKLSQSGLSRTGISICAGLISFGGLSIFAQSIAFLSKTDINAIYYFFIKILNGAFASILCWFGYPLIDFSAQADALPAFAISPVNRFVVSTFIYAIVLIMIFAAAFTINIANIVKASAKKSKFK